MAAIINDKDKLLQAPPNIRLEQAASNYIYFSTPAPVFNLDSAGVASPVNYAVTAKLAGQLAGTVVWSTTSGTVATTGQSGNTWTIAATDLTTNTATIRASLTFLGVVYTSDLTISKVSSGTSGTNGTNAVTLNYSNNSLTVPQTNAGVSTWTGSGGQLQVYDGTTLLTLFSTTQSTTTPATNGTYVLSITKVSGDTLTVPTFSGTTTVTLAAWSGTLLTATVYRITAYVKTTAGATISVTRDVSISPSKAGADSNKNTTVELYQWSTIQPNNPTGTSSLTWSPPTNSTYTGANGWQVAVPTNPNTSLIKLWVASKSVTDTYSAVTTSVDWTTGVTVYQSTQNGASGIQSTEAIVYQWASSLPAIAGTSTYIWESGSVYNPPSSWSTTLSDTGTAGQTLWKASVALTDSVTATTTSIAWSSASIVPFGYVGSTGAVGRIAYTKSTTSLGTYPNTYTVSGDSLPASNSWNSDNARVATTASITLSGTQTIDGTVLVAGDRVLVKNQSDTTTNGLYIVASGAWSRAPEADTWSKLLELKVYVLSGGTHSASWWISDTTPTGTLGSTAITFSQRTSIVVSCATTANITLSGLQTIDGVVLTAGARVLVKNQTLQQNNGIYAAASTSWTRTTDANAWSELVGINVNVNSGTINAGTAWLSTVAAGGTLGTTAITFTTNNTAWSYTTPTTISGENVWQSEGVYNPATNQTIWEVPYLAALKVGNLSAISTNTGSLTVSGNITVGANGNIRGGQTDYSVGTGFFLGYSGGTHKLSIGTPTASAIPNLAGDYLTLVGHGFIVGDAFYVVNNNNNSNFKSNYVYYVTQVLSADTFKVGEYDTSTTSLNLTSAVNITIASKSLTWSGTALSTTGKLETYGDITALGNLSTFRQRSKLSPSSLRFYSELGGQGLFAGTDSYNASYSSTGFYINSSGGFFAPTASIYDSNSFASLVISKSVAATFAVLEVSTLNGADTAISVEGRVDSTNTIRCTGADLNSGTVFTTGKGLEVTYIPSSNTGYLQSYNRDTSSWTGLYLSGSKVTINGAGTGSSGLLGIGTELFGTSAGNVIAIARGTAPTTSPTSVGQIFVDPSTGHLKFRHDNGTVYNLTS